jgi:hypothetical protein
MGWVLSWYRVCLLRPLSGFECRHLSKNTKWATYSKGVANTLEVAKELKIREFLMFYFREILDVILLSQNLLVSAK